MRLKEKCVWAFVLFVFWTSSAFAAAAQLGAGPSSAGGPGVDLKAIASPKKPQAFTGFPAGTLPGDGRGGEGAEEKPSNNPVGKVVFSGDPLDPVIGSEMAGSTLHYICAIAGHMGYTIEGGAYLPTSLDVAYTFRLMNGRRRISTLYFDRGLKLLEVR